MTAEAPTLPADMAGEAERPPAGEAAVHLAECLAQHVDALPNDGGDAPTSLARMAELLAALEQVCRGSTAANGRLRRS